MAIYIYQIFYNEETLKNIPRKFIALDNSHSQNASWFEYIAIKKVFSEFQFNENDYIGIFSPRFFEKTGMSDIEVFKAVSDTKKEIISFSPLFSQNALNQNSFYQGDAHHPGLFDLSQKILHQLNLKINLQSLWQDQTRIIFANYFVATYRFWKLWRTFSEQFFQLANDRSNSLHHDLNSYCMHRGSVNHYQFKIFFMERLVSLILEKYALNANLGIIKENYLIKNPSEKNYFEKYLILDSLKSQYIKTDNNEFKLLYIALQREINQPSKKFKKITNFLKST